MPGYMTVYGWMAAGRGWRTGNTVPNVFFHGSSCTCIKTIAPQFFERVVIFQFLLLRIVLLIFHMGIVLLFSLSNTELMLEFNLHFSTNTFGKHLLAFEMLQTSGYLLVYVFIVLRPLGIIVVSDCVLPFPFSFIFSYLFRRHVVFIFVLENFFAFGSRFFKLFGSFADLLQFIGLLAHQFFHLQACLLLYYIRNCLYFCLELSLPPLFQHFFVLSLLIPQILPLFI